MMYAFAKPEAIRSFREAWKRDPNCAICYWGEAWAWGSYLNAPMSADEAPHAYAATQKALALKNTHATAKERAFIDAMAVRYVEKFDPESASIRTRSTPRRWARRRCLSGRSRRSHAARRRAVPSRAAARHARLPEPTRAAATPRARAHPREGCAPSWRLPSVRTCHRVDGRARARKRVRRVPRQVDSRCEPYQPHAVTHVERGGAMGRFRAREPRSVALRSEGAIGEGFAIYPSHNLHMLLYAASMDGRARSRCRLERTTRSSRAIRSIRCSRR